MSTVSQIARARAVAGVRADERTTRLAAIEAAAAAARQAAAAAQATVATAAALHAEISSLFGWG